MNDPFNPQSLLEWYLDMGVDETIGNDSLDRYALTQTMLAKNKAMTAATSPPQNPGLAPQSQERLQGTAPPPQQEARENPKTVAATQQLVQTAQEQAANCHTVEELKKAVLAYEGCPLKATATHTVFADGNPGAKIMFIGEAPGAEEDRSGLPFVGASGQLLDKMLYSCGFQPQLGDRSEIYITNTIFWRPPGNRPPTDSEIAICQPFVERHIELVNPSLIVMLGGAAAKSILHKKDGISRLRGRWFDHQTSGLSQPILATALFHPAYLLRSPGQKRRAWSDLLSIREKAQNRG